jgi:hypothetical protein
VCQNYRRRALNTKGLIAFSKIDIQKPIARYFWPTCMQPICSPIIFVVAATVMEKKYLCSTSATENVEFYGFLDEFISFKLGQWRC